MPRRNGRRDVKLGEKKCFTAEPKCGIISAKGGVECIGGALSNLFEQKASYIFLERSDRGKRSFARSARWICGVECIGGPPVEVCRADNYDVI